jgi:hypothetical protein
MPDGSARAASRKGDAKERDQDHTGSTEPIRGRAAIDRRSVILQPVPHWYFHGVEWCAPQIASPLDSFEK